MERWKPIAGYEGFYEVSNHGRVKSIKRSVPNPACGGQYTVNERILHQAQSDFGHKNVVLSKNGVSTHKLVHRLVAEAFLENPNDYPCVNHKDENPSNNNLSNLEWCTQKYNSNYGNASEKKSAAQKKRDWSFRKTSGCNRKGVEQVSVDGVLINTFASLTDAANATGANITKISACCNGKRKTANGYQWRFL